MSRTRVEEFFERALERDAAERSGFLAALRETDPEIAEEVVELLQAHELSDRILDAPIAQTPKTASDDVQRRIGPYRVLRELGRGGMGVVYLAERDDGQFRRRVAVKLLRSSPDADELQQRFRAERQILALLEHPNIAQLIDGGVTDGRLPYLVMEYVEGLPITQYCERHQLSVTERLRLFQDVCAAVHHAHRNLVIHRDLKPGNILVTQSGQVKLLDFGIAKLLNPAFAIAPPVTWTSHRVLTPEYASPEQLHGEPLSTTSDVYALGVVLYELLTGRRPHEARDGSHADLVTRVCEQEPTRPSTVKGARELRGDVDAIVLMALRKEPSRRYGSADLLAQDVQRYLEGLPVLAHKGSRSYYVRKFVSRHHITVATAAMFVVSLITGAAVALNQTATARNERDRARIAQREAEGITSFLVSMFQANDPDQLQGQETTARDLLRRGVQRAEDLRDQPLVQARILNVIGRVYHSLGDYAQARASLERALGIREAQLGANHPDVAETLMDLSQTLRYLGQYEESKNAAQRAVDIRVRAFGPMHPEVATGLLQVAMMAVYLTDINDAIALTRRAVSIREAAFGAKDTTVANAVMTLGLRVGGLGEYEEAEQHLRRAIAINRSISPESPELAGSLLGLAYLLDAAPGRDDEAEVLYREGLRMRRSTLGVGHPLSNYALGDLSYFLATHGRAKEALPLAREHLAAAQRLFGHDNVRSAGIMVAYAQTLRAAGLLDSAIVVTRQVLDVYARTLGKEHAGYGNVLADLGSLLDQQGKSAEAEKLILESIAIRRKAVAGRPDGGLIARAYADLSSIQRRGGRMREAEQSLLQAFKIDDELGVRTVQNDYQYILRKAVELYDAIGKTSEADKYRKLVVND